MEYLRSLHFSWEKISHLLCISISTLQRRRKEFCISSELTGFTNISDEELDALHQEIVKQVLSLQILGGEDLLGH